MLEHLDSVVVALVLFNVAVSAAQKALEIVKDKTSTDADNKVYEFLSKYAGYLQKGIDWISANRQHK